MENKQITYALLQMLNKDPRPALFGFRSPGCVRAGALLGIENREESDFLVRHATKDIQRYPELLELVDSLQNDGHWGISRIKMKAAGIKKAEKNAVRTALLNYSCLMLYGFSLSDKKSQLKHFIAFSNPYIYSPAIKRNRLSSQASYLSMLLAYSGLSKLIPGPYRKLMQESIDATAQGKPAANPFLQQRPLRSAAASHWALHAGSNENVPAAARQLLQWFSEFSQENEEPDKLSRLSIPSISFTWFSCLQLAILADMTVNDPLIKPVVTEVTELQQKDSLWHAGGREPIPDGNLFLTLEIVLAIKELVKNSVASGELDDSESEETPD